jgi:hypothetical protein
MLNFFKNIFHPQQLNEDIMEKNFKHSNLFSNINFQQLIEAKNVII